MTNDSTVIACSPMNSDITCWRNVNASPNQIAVNTTSAIRSA